MINKKLLKEIEEYCNINNINDIEKEVNKILRIGFNVVKFGTSPFSSFQEKDFDNKVTDNEIQNENIEKEQKPKKRLRIIKNE